MQTGPRELVVRDLDGNAVTIPLDRERIGLGRSAANELCYPDDHGLSRHHLVLIREIDGWRVEDLGSKNGTLLNGQRLEKSAPFKPGDRISAGHLVIEYAEPGASAPSETVMFVDAESFST